MNATDVKKTADEFNAGAGERLLRQVYARITNHSQDGLYWYKFQIKNTSETTLTELMNSLREEGFKLRFENEQDGCGGMETYLVISWY